MELQKVRRLREIDDGGFDQVGLDGDPQGLEHKPKIMKAAMEHFFSFWSRGRELKRDNTELIYSFFSLW